VIFIVEDKKYGVPLQDCQAVSEVMGTVLMISIVVLAFSSVALTIFSEGDSMDPPHTPHTNLRENINTSEDTVEIFHNGGEEIDLKDIMIILNTQDKLCLQKWIQGQKRRLNSQKFVFRVLFRLVGVIHPV